MRRRLVLLALAASATLAAPAGAFPPNPRRPTPPEGIDARAVPVGRPAPDIDLPAHDDRRWSLAAARAAGPVVLVFYRGDW